MLQSVKKHATILICAILTAFVFTAGAKALSVKGIYVSDNGSEKVYYQTLAGTVEEFLKEENIELFDEDKITPPVDCLLEDKMTITITRAIEITVIIDGKERETLSTTALNASRVLETLIERDNLTYVLDDEINPSKKLKTGDEFRIGILNEETEIIEEELPFETQTVENSEMLIGTEKISVQGVAGTKQITVKKTYISGNLLQTEEIETVITKEPITQVIEKGIKQEDIIETAQGNFRTLKKITMNASAYTAISACATKKPGDRGYGITATGRPAKRGVAAVDPNVIPLGTELYIEGYGYAIAADTGGSIKSNKIDLCFDTHNECIQFGRRNVTVHIVERV